MSALKNIRIYPNHGTRSATITWCLGSCSEPGEVYIAHSHTGTEGSWKVKNEGAPVAAAVGMYEDVDFVSNSHNQDNFYRLLLQDTNGDNHFSQPIQVLGDITTREYGAIRAMIHQEFTRMRVTDGFPVWHCIPKTSGELASNVDPDTGLVSGLECEGSEANAYGEKYQGGYYCPVLTWMQVLQHARGLKDDPEEFSTLEINRLAVRLLAFPTPARGHMFINPATDERWLVTDEVKPAMLRGTYPVSYNATLEVLNRKDERYKFQPPEFDTKEYRNIKYWTPTPCVG